MKVKLYTNFVKGIVAKVLAKMLVKTIGYDVRIHIDELEIEEHLGDITLKANIEAKMRTEDFLKVVGIFEEDES